MSDLAAQAATYHAEAELLRKAGDREGALVRQRRAVALWRELGDAAPLAHAVRHIADMLVEAGRAGEASEPIAEMLALYRQAGDAPPLDVANALRSAAIHAEAIGDRQLVKTRKSRSDRRLSHARLSLTQRPAPPTSL